MTDTEQGHIFYDILLELKKARNDGAKSYNKTGIVCYRRQDVAPDRNNYQRWNHDGRNGVAAFQQNVWICIVWYTIIQ